MRIARYLRGALLFAMCVVAISCSGPAEDTREDVKPLVYVSILPQKYFADRIGGGHFRTEVLVLPGQSPATYDPTPRQIAALDEASVLLLAGVPFERQLRENIEGRLENLRVVDTSEGIEKIRFEETGDNEHHNERHDAHDEHAGEHSVHKHAADELDPHTWLDPGLAEEHARIIAAELINISPEHEDDINTNLSALIEDMDSVDDEIADSLEPLAGNKLYVFHPAFGYFARAYGLEQVAVETGGREPGAKYIAEIIEMAKADNVRVIFVQPQFSKKSAGAIAESIDGAVIDIDPLAYEYMDNLRHIADEIKQALGGR